MAPTFSGGKLNLKGSKKAKKKKHKKSKHGLKNDKDGIVSSLKHERNEINDDNGHDDDHEDGIDHVSDDDLTPTERKSLERKKKRQREELEQVGSKSHRERIEEFNEKLGKLTEHNDIPRVRLSFMFFLVLSFYTIKKRCYNYFKRTSSSLLTLLFLLPFTCVIFWCLLLLLFL